MTSDQAENQIMDWPWPFSQADLAAGLRRFFVDPTIWIEEVKPLSLAYVRPSIGRIRAAVIAYKGQSTKGTVRLIVKEPRGTTRTGLAGAGRREVGVYRYLASEIPVNFPRIIAASDAGDWMIMEELSPIKAPEAWEAEDYRTATESLVALHDRFWGLSEDLAAFPWLSRPLDADFEVHVAAAGNSLERIVDQGLLSNWPDRVHTLAHLILHAEKVIEPLKREPSTLLHGDFWPGNISVLKDDRQIVYDWQMAAVGPPILDVVTFVLKSEWWFGGLPIDREQITQEYRKQLAEISGKEWDDDAWEELWDHALMWRFLQEWMDLLAASPTTLLQTRAELLEQVWFDPLGEAVTKRLLV